MPPTASPRRCRAQVKLDHPDSPDLAFLYGTILTDGRSGITPKDSNGDGASANICVFAEREVDRSPTGSGVTARIALAVARDPALISADFTFESITGSRFTGRVAEQTTAGRFASIRAEVSGRAYYTGRSIFTLEPDDPLAGGFLLK